MFQYHCLNPIADVGLNKFTANYKKTEEIGEADGVLVRSASMHDMELPERLLAVARAGAGGTIFRWISVRRKASLFSIRPERMPTG